MDKWRASKIYWRYLIALLIALKLYGRKWKLIEKYVETRTGTQIRSHAQKHYLKIGSQDPNQESSHKSDKLVSQLNENEENPILDKENIQFKHKTEKKLSFDEMNHSSSNENPNKMNDIDINDKGKSDIENIITAKEEKIISKVDNFKPKEILPDGVITSINENCFENDWKETIDNISELFFKSLMFDTTLNTNKHNLKECEEHIAELRKSTNALMSKLVKINKLE